MNQTIGRILSALISAGGWLLVGARIVLDLVGYSTAPDDVQIAATRLDQLFVWLLGVPWWAVFGFALLSTMWLIWVSWRPNGQPEVGGPPTIASDENHSQPIKPQVIGPLDTYFSKKVIRIVDLVHGSNYVIEDKIFEDCALYGPAIITFIPGHPLTMERSSFEGYVEDVFIVAEDNRKILGAVGFKGCTFKRCQFIGVGFIGSAIMVQHVKDGFN